MAHVEEFTINGLAGRPTPVHRRLDRHMNIFWGLNGTGKTSLLKILNSALSNQVAVLNRVPFDSAEVVFRTSDNGATIRRTITQAAIDFDDNDDDPFDEGGMHLEPAGEGLWREVEQADRVRTWTSALVAGDVPGTGRIAGGRVMRNGLNGAYRHSYLPISRLTQVRPGVYARRGNTVIDDAYLDEDFAEQVRSRWQAYNSEALAQIRSIQQQGLAAILALVFGGGYAGETHAAEMSQSVPGENAYELVKTFLGEQGITLRATLQGFLYQYERQPEQRAVVDAIQEVTREADLTLRPQREFQSVIELLYSGSKSLVLDAARPARNSLRVEIDGSPIPLQSLSSGEKQLLRLMLETLASGPSTIMIDEPELSMHVDWQRVLVSSMLNVNPECQLLLATHSPEVMADVPDSNVFEL